MYEATYISNYVHTPPAGFGKIMSAVQPRLAVGYHIWPNPSSTTLCSRRWAGPTMDPLSRPPI